MPDILRMVKRWIHDNFAVVLFRPVFQKITQPDADAREMIPEMADQIRVQLHGVTLCPWRAFPDRP